VSLLTSRLKDFVAIDSHWFESPGLGDVKPGDLCAVAWQTPGPSYDVPMTSPHPDLQLEREAFTGRAEVTVTGWFWSGDVALVVAVKGDHAYLWSNRGRGWVARGYIVAV
jgi:hypothetical protein